jgi:hypothetical protein
MAIMRLKRYSFCNHSSKCHSGCNGLSESNAGHLVLYEDVARLLTELLQHATVAVDTFEDSMFDIDSHLQRVRGITAEIALMEAHHG